MSNRHRPSEANSEITRHSNGTSDRQRQSGYYDYTQKTDDQTSRSDRHQRPIENPVYRSKGLTFDTDKSSRDGPESYRPSYELRSRSDKRREESRHTGQPKEEARHTAQTSSPLVHPPQDHNRSDAKPKSVQQFFTKEEVHPRVLRAWAKATFGDNATVNNARIHGLEGYALITPEKPAQQHLDAIKEKSRQLFKEEASALSRQESADTKKSQVTPVSQKNEQTGRRQTRTNPSTKDASDGSRESRHQNGSDDTAGSPETAKPKLPETPNTRPEPPPEKPDSKPKPKPDPEPKPNPKPEPGPRIGPRPMAPSLQPQRQEQQGGLDDDNEPRRDGGRHKVSVQPNTDSRKSRDDDLRRPKANEGRKKQGEDRYRVRVS